MSNETLNSETAKTKSARKQQLTQLMWVLLAAAAILFIGVGGFLGATRTGVGCAISIPAHQPSSTDYTTAAPARDCIYLEKVNSEQDRSIGLSKYDMLPQTQGMLFVFDGPQSACMWMKDMNFAIDIVWLNEKKQISKIENNVTPDTYPQQFCQDETQYVIELVAGVADKAGLYTGQTLAL